MRRSCSLLLLLLVLRLALGLAYSALNPLGEAPDEADHYAYAAYIGTEHRLPVGSYMTQSKHPPLYHLLAAAAAAPFTALDFTFLRSNPDAGFKPGDAPNFFVHTALEGWPWQGGALAMHLGRLVSLAAALIVVAATYGLGRRLWPAWPAGALAAAAFVALLPEGLFVGGSMSNDMLAAAFATLALWAGIRPAAAPPDRGFGPGMQPDAGRQRRAWLWAIAAGICMGLAFVTKVSTVALWPVVVVSMLLEGHRTGDKAAAREAILQAILAPVIGLAIAAPWLMRNWHLYGDPLGTQLMLATIDRRQNPLAAADLLALARGWFFSFWGKFGAAGHLALPWPFYVVWGVLLAGAAAGWLRWGLLRWRHREGLLYEAGSATALVLIAAPILTVLSILSYSQIALGTDQGRLLFPALAPAGLLLAGGWAAWQPRGLRDNRLPAAMAAGMATCAVLALALGILKPFAPPSTPPAAEIQRSLSVGQTFGADLQLVAMRWDESRAADAPDPTLTLYWQAQAPLKDDLRITLRLLDKDGNLIWELKRSPGAGRYSTDRWPAGVAVADLYRIPLDKFSLAARVELGVFSFPGGIWAVPRGQEGEFLTLARPQP